MNRELSEDPIAQASNPGGGGGSGGGGSQNGGGANQHSPNTNGQTATPASSVDNGGGSKRKRVSLACNACRLRKSKVSSMKFKNSRVFISRRLKNGQISAMV